MDHAQARSYCETHRLEMIGDFRLYEPHRVLGNEIAGQRFLHPAGDAPALVAPPFQQNVGPVLHADLLIHSVGASAVQGQHAIDAPALRPAVLAHRDGGGELGKRASAWNRDRRAKAGSKHMRPIPTLPQREEEAGTATACSISRRPSERHPLQKRYLTPTRSVRGSTTRLSFPSTGAASKAGI